MRLFLAINLREDVRAAVGSVVGPLRPLTPGIRWVAPERVHITLKFLGECDPGRAAEVAAVVGTMAAATPAMSFGLSGAGVFPNFRRPRVVWVGVKQPQMAAIATEIERVLEPLGVPVERRPFAPHLTVGRVDGHLAPGELDALRQWAASVGDVGEQAIDSIELMRSDLGRGGPTYSILASAPVAH